MIADPPPTDPLADDDDEEDLPPAPADGPEDPGTLRDPSLPDD